MPRAWSTCSTPTCPEPTPPGTSRCDGCTAQAEARRGSASSRGYGHAHTTRFRKGVLAKHPICVLCMRKPSVRADHWPRGRDELARLGMDANDPKHGRGLCESCDSRQTARRQPGGWNAR